MTRLLTSTLPAFACLLLALASCAPAPRTDAAAPSASPPAWARAHGRDAHGLCADAVIAGVRQRFRHMPAGDLRLSADGDDLASPDAIARRPLTHVPAFWLADTECTRKLWSAVMSPDAPPAPDAHDHPAAHVSWHDARRFCLRVRALHPSLAPSLPTDAQWEHAARAGGPARISDENLAQLAWFKDNSDGAPHPVRTRHPNPWGLYDMFGNVREWCQDAFPPPPGDDDRDLRSYRGGGWNDIPSYCGVIYRWGVDPATRYNDLGFRLALPATHWHKHSEPNHHKPSREERLQ